MESSRELAQLANDIAARVIDQHGLENMNDVWQKEECIKRYVDVYGHILYQQVRDLLYQEFYGKQP